MSIMSHNQCLWHIVYDPPLHNKAVWDYESMRSYSIDGNNTLRVKSSFTNISNCSPNLGHISPEENILYSIREKHFPSHLRFCFFLIFKLMLTRTEAPIFQDFFSLIGVSVCNQHYTSFSRQHYLEFYVVPYLF